MNLQAKPIAKIGASPLDLPRSVRDDAANVPDGFPSALARQLESNRPAATGPGAAPGLADSGSSLPPELLAAAARRDGESGGVRSEVGTGGDPPSATADTSVLAAQLPELLGTPRPVNAEPAPESRPGEAADAGSAPPAEATATGPGALMSVVATVSPGAEALPEGGWPARSMAESARPAAGPIGGMKTAMPALRWTPGMNQESVGRTVEESTSTDDTLVHEDSPVLRESRGTLLLQGRGERPWPAPAIDLARGGPTEASPERLAPHRHAAAVPGLTGVEALAGSGLMAEAAKIAPPVPGAAASLAQPVGRDAWQEELGQRVLWLVDRKLGTAEVKLNPAELGPLQIQIRMENDQASIHFTAHQAAVREALEAAVPKLRELLGAQQIALTEVSVTPPEAEARGQGGAFDAPPRQSPHFRTGAGAGDAAAGGADPHPEPDRPAAVGLVNFYA